MGQQKFPEAQPSLEVEKTWAAYAQNAFTAFSERASCALLGTSFQRAAEVHDWGSHPFSILSSTVEVSAKLSSPPRASPRLS